MRIWPILFFAILGFALESDAQVALSMESWHRGTVSLNNSDKEIEGEIKYDMPKNTLLVKSSDGKTLSLSSTRVAQFNITDSNTGKHREFYSIPYQTDKSYKRPVFFEILYEDSHALLCREDIIEEQVPIGTTFGFGMMGAPINYRYVKREVFYFYLLTANNEIVALSSDTKKITDCFAERRNEVSDFIENQSIDPKKIADMIRLIQFYNEISR